MVRSLPVKLLREFGGDSLLALNTERVDRVDEINRWIFRQLANHSHRIIKVALNLEHGGAVIETLREFRETNLAARNEYGADKTSASGISRKTCRCVTGTRANKSLDP